jgi:hypothetical protein
MYHRYVPSYATNSPEMRPSCSKNLDERMKKRNDDSVVEVNGNKASKSRLN